MVDNENDEKFPSPVRATGDLPGYGGTLTFDANMQLLKEMPDFNYNMKLNELQLVKLNDLSKRYGGIDFEQGTLDLVSEMEMVDGKLQGYLKPLTHNMQIFEWNEGDNRTITQFVKELIAEGGNKILENKVKDQVATRIPLEGTVDDIQTGIWPTIIGVLRNGYVSALTDNLRQHPQREGSLGTLPRRPPQTTPGTPRGAQGRAGGKESGAEGKGLTVNGQRSTVNENWLATNRVPKSTNPHQLHDYTIQRLHKSTPYKTTVLLSWINTRSLNTNFNAFESTSFSVSRPRVAMSAGVRR